MPAACLAGMSTPQQRLANSNNSSMHDMKPLNESVLKLHIWKEKPASSRTPQSVKNENKSLKRKLFTCSNNIDEDPEKRHAASVTPPSTTPKRRRSLLAGEGSPTPGSTPKTPGGGGLCRLTVPLSERQQVALLMQMTAEESQQGDSSPRPSSPPSALKRTPLDKKVNKRNDRGETPIHLAAIRGDCKLTKRLIKAGVDVNIKDYAGWTPLHEACNHGWLEIARQLLRAGANVNVQGYDNDTPLHDAAINGHHKLVQLLLRHGANPVQANSVGKSALDVATAADILRLLRSELIASSSGGSSAGDDVRSPTSPDEDEDDEEAEKSHGVSGADIQRREDDPNGGASKQLFPSACETDGGSLYRRCPVPADMSDGAVENDGDRAVEGTKARFARLMADKSYLRGLGEPLSDHLPVSAHGDNSLKRSAHAVDSKWSPRLTLKFQHVKTQERRPADSQQVAPAMPATDADKVYSVTLANSYDNRRVSGGVNGPSGAPQFEDISDAEEEEDDRTAQHPVATPIFHFPPSSVATKTSPPPPSHIPASDCQPQQRVDGWLEGAAGESQRCHQVTAPHRSLPKSPKSPKICASSHYDAKMDDSRKCVTSCSTGQMTLPQVTSDERPPSPKVPPLKIIMPSTSSCSSVKTTPKTVSARHALPYVFNPTVTGAECDKTTDNVQPTKEVPTTVGKETGTEADCAPSGGRRNKHRGSNSASEKNEKSIPVVDKNTNAVDKNATVDKNLTVDKKVTVSKGVDSDKAAADKDEASEDATKTTTSETKTKDEEEKKEEETSTSSVNSERRLTRAALRSQQLQQQQRELDADAQTTGKEDSQTTDADSNTSGKSHATRSDSTTHATSATTSGGGESLHRKRRLRHLAEHGRATPPPGTTPQPVERLSNPYTKFLEIQRKMCSQWSQWETIAPKPPPGYQDYLTVSGSYVLHGNNAASKLAVPMLPPPTCLSEPMKELFAEHEKARYRLRLQHVTERERLVLCTEQEIIRVHGRAARALAQQPLPLSACSVLCHANRCKPLEFVEPPANDDLHTGRCGGHAVRSRYNGRQLISWQQDVTDKFEKIKEHMLLRQHNEAEALQAVQRLEWQWRLASERPADRHVAPPVDEACVPLVPVADDFDLLPTSS